jgi:hypothetical protein
MNSEASNAMSFPKPPIMQRMWVNAPSTLQAVHHHHGLRVLVTAAVNGGEGMVDVYPVEGSVTRMRIPSLYLSKGWPEKLDGVERSEGGVK